MKNSAYKLALASGVALCTIGFAGNAFAQTAGNVGNQTDSTTSPAPAAPPEGDIVVTGSLIRQPNLTATSPLTTINQAAFQQQSLPNVQDVLLRLPQVYAGTNSRTGFTSNAGASTISLRNLGTNRTLILIDGKRLAPLDAGGGGAADISIIPAMLIKRVDIVTGGASAAYGSDALGGVVNFVMDRLEGFRVDVSGGGFQHNNNNDFVRGLQTAKGFKNADPDFFGGEYYDVSLAGGVTSRDGRGHVQAYFDYRKQQPIKVGQLDYAACALATSGTSVACSGSSTVGSTRFLAVNGTSASYYLDPTNGTLRAYSSGDAYTGQFGNLQISNSRYQAGFMADYEFTPDVKAYATFSYLKNTTATEVSPTQLTGTARTINCGNAMLTAQERTLFCRGATTGTFTANLTRRNVEGPTRTLYGVADQFRFTTGVDADAGPFHFNVHAQYTRGETNFTYANDFSSSRVNLAINNCQDSGGAAVAGCVPYNIFQPGAVTSAALAYVQASGALNTLVTEKLVSATVNGDLGKFGVKLPWATDGLSFALGTEYREEAYLRKPDYQAASGDLETFGQFSSIAGGYRIKEFFGEARLPLVQNRPFIEDLSLGSAFRVSDYNTFGTTTTYAFNANYAPTRDVRFRGSYNRAIRAPSLQELFTSYVISYGNYTVDNCEGTAPVYTRAQCANTGVTAGQYGNIIAAPPGLYHNSSNGGNPNLQPEKANTFSAGAVLTPTFLPGFSLTVDWFDITIKGTIAAPPPQTVLDQCALTGSPFYCGLVHRDPASGSLWLNNNGYVFGALINAGTTKTSGVDVNAFYSLNSGIGRFGFNLAGNYTYRQDIQIIQGGAVTACAGKYGNTCGIPTPKWHHTFSIDWKSRGAFDVNAAWRFVSAEHNDDPAVLAFGSRIGAQSYFDLGVAYHLAKRYTLRLGVNNVFDKDPPIVTSAGFSISNSYPSSYDTFGRSLFGRISANF